MEKERLWELIRQPEGLKLDFKSKFYQLDLQDPKARERQWGELIKDILALANGNVNIAGETGHIIFGIGDKIFPDGSRELIDVGNIQITRQRILEKINSACSPPLPDLNNDLLLLEGNRILVITIPPSPYIHETTRRIQTSRGQSYPEHTVFIRRGEGIHPASMPEIQVIASEKQKLVEGISLPKKDVGSQVKQRDKRVFFDKVTIAIIIVTGVLLSILGFIDGDTLSDRAIGAIVFFVTGLILGFFYSVLVKFVHWIIQKRERIKKFAYFLFWAPIFVSAFFGIFMAENPYDLFVNVMTGLTIGTLGGLILVFAACGIDWFVENIRFSSR